MKTAVTVLFVFLWVLVVPVFAGIRPTTLAVVPGDSLGYVKIGDTKSRVFSVLGMPDELSRDGANTYWMYDITGTKDEKFIISWTEPAPGVDFIQTDSRVAEINGVRVGSTLRDVFKAIGVPDRIDTAGYGRLRVWYNTGLRFVIGTAGNVVVITVLPRP